MAEIHGASLPLRTPAANSKSNLTIFAFFGIALEAMGSGRLPVF
jgi:hypothetical protein